MAVPDSLAEAGDDGYRVHAHPEAVARIEVGRDRLAERRDALEALHVVDGGAGVELQTDQQSWVLGPGEVGKPGPVGEDAFLPLGFVDALQVGQPAAGREVGDAVAAGPRRAAGEGNHPVE